MNCVFCSKNFENVEKLQLHVINCCHNAKIQIQCPNCGRCFSRKPNLNKHMKLNRCKVKANQLTNEFLKLEQKLDERLNLLEQSTAKGFSEIKEKSAITNINNNLQVICISSNDNYLDMLTKEWGSFDRALEYIKDCALSSLTGDCQLIEKIYLGGLYPNVHQQDDIVCAQSIHYVDKSRNKIEYYNEKKEKIIDNKEVFGRKIANNLQNSYLKGVNYLITQNLENHKCPNKFLEEYDLQIWNQHIYDLSDVRYQKKIVNQLNIPIQ